jgi:hypothetical protein
MLHREDSLMSRHGATLLDNGYHVIPIRPGTKVPGRFVRGEWYDLGGWQDYCDKPPTPWEVSLWGGNPGCAVGIACGNVVGIDIDVMDAPLASRVEKMARDMLGDTPALRIGLAPKRMLIYRADTPFSGRKRRPLEVLARGNQFLAYAIHPDTGQPYAWPDESLVEVDIGRLPVITHDAAIAWIDAAYALIPESMRPASLIGAKGGAVSTWQPSDPRGTLAAVTSALEYVPNTDLDGASWITIGNAIKGALGEDGRALWLDWSRQSVKSGLSGKSDTPERRWKGFRPHSIGAGTIYQLALDRGWVPDAALTLNASVAEAAEGFDPTAEFMSRLAARKDAKEAAKAAPKVARNPNAVPPEVYQVGGVIGSWLAYVERTAIAPQPFLALGAALCMVGVVAGRRYASHSNLRTNMYAVAIAGSGGGKEHARECVKMTLTKAGLGDYLGGEGISAGSAILSSLHKFPARLFQLDEFADLIANVQSKRASSFHREIWTNLTKLLTSAKSIMLGTEYTHQEDRPRIDLHQPCLCLYGTSTPLEFWRALESSATTNGSLARYLIFISELSHPDKRIIVPHEEVPHDVILGLQNIAQGVPGHDYGGNLSSTMSAEISMVPYKVPLGDGAEAILADMISDETRWKRQYESAVPEAFVARYVEHATKLALIRSISDCPENPVMTAECLQWAVTLTRHCIDCMIRESRRLMAETDYEKRYKRVLDAVRKAGEISKSDLGRRTQGISPKEREEVMRALIESGLVVPRQDGEGDRKALVYVAVGDAESW